MNVPWALLVGYAVGSAPAGFVIVRLARGVDLRRAGSGNVGATNVYRTSGAAIAVVVLLVDIAKGVVSVLLAGPGDAAVVAGSAAVVGHVYPVWLGFRGGKGVATATGVFAMIAPGATGIAAVVFLGIVAVTHYVSLGSVVGAVVLGAATWWLGPRASALGATAVAALILIAHRDNLVRLWRGTERSLGT